MNTPTPPSRANRWRGLLLALPGIGTALLPKLTCPFCWPAYAAALGAVGVSITSYDPALFWTTLVLTAVAVGSLGLRAKARRGYGPVLLGLLAGAALMVARFGLSSAPGTYAGAGFLMVAAVWNAWPLRKPQPLEDGRCEACRLREAAEPAPVQI